MADDMEEDVEEIQEGGAADDELSLPKGQTVWTILCQLLVVNIFDSATVTKLIGEMMPPGIVCSKEARNLIIDSCVGQYSAVFRKKCVGLTLP